MITYALWLDGRRASQEWHSRITHLGQPLAVPLEWLAYSDWHPYHRLTVDRYENGRLTRSVEWRARLDKGCFRREPLTGLARPKIGSKWTWKEMGSVNHQTREYPTDPKKPYAHPHSFTMPLPAAPRPEDLPIPELVGDELRSIVKTLDAHGVPHVPVGNARCGPSYDRVRWLMDQLAGIDALCDAEDVPKTMSTTDEPPQHEKIQTIERVSILIHKLRHG